MWNDLELFIITFGYIGIGISLYAEHVFPPFPGQFTIPIAGVLISQNELNFFGVWMAGTAGAVFGSWTLYWLASRWNKEQLARYQKRLRINAKQQKKIEDFFGRHGNQAVFLAHIIPFPVTRVLVSLLSSPYGIRQSVYLLYTSLGTVIWIGIWLYIVVILGSEIPGF